MCAANSQDTPRINHNQLADVTQQDASTGSQTETMASTINVGPDGVRFQAGAEFEVGAQILICFTMSERLIQAWAQVTECTSGDDGAVIVDTQFSSIYDEDREFLRQYCLSKAGAQ